MEEKAAAAAADQEGTAVYCSEHPYPPGATAAGPGGICAFCLQKKLGMLVSSSKSSPFHPPPPPQVPASPSSPPSSQNAISQLPLHSSGVIASHEVMPPQKTMSSSSPAIPAAGGGLKRSKSVAPRPEEPLAPAPAPSADSPRKKSGFWSFLHLSSSSSSSSSHKSASSTATANSGIATAAARRNSVSAASASLGGRRLEAIVEPEESPGRRSEGSSSSSFGRKVARSRSVGCGSRSFSGDFLERLSNGFGDCALRRVESHREPKPKAGALGHLGDEYEQRHRIKCAGFLGGMGAAPPPSSSSYWLSAPVDGASGSGGGPRARSSRSQYRSWAWALAVSPMRVLIRPSSSTSSKSIMAAPHGRNSGISAVATS